MTIAYAVTCPACGGPLQPVALTPQDAPWLCAATSPCHRGFWATHLGVEGRKLYRKHHHDLGHGLASENLMRRIELERAAAHVRGTSLREDQLSIVSLEALKSIRPLGEFKTLVEDEIARREAPNG